MNFQIWKVLQQLNKNLAYKITIPTFSDNYVEEITNFLYPSVRRYIRTEQMMKYFCWLNHIKIFKSSANYLQQNSNENSENYLDFLTPKKEIF